MHKAEHKEKDRAKAKVVVKAEEAEEEAREVKAWEWDVESKVLRPFASAPTVGKRSPIGKECHV